MFDKAKIIKKLKKILIDVKDFAYGFFIESAVDLLEKEAYEQEDLYTLLLFSDLLGIPNPVSYYTMELLPYIAEDMTNWEIRMMRKEEILAERFGRHDFSP